MDEFALMRLSQHTLPGWHVHTRRIVSIPRMYYHDLSIYHVLYSFLVILESLSVSIISDLCSQQDMLAIRHDCNKHIRDEHVRDQHVRNMLEPNMNVEADHA